MGSAYDIYLAARDGLLAAREDYTAAYRDFTWPQLDEFNWALDWFDRMAQDNDATALWIVEEDGTQLRLSFAEMARRSSAVAGWLRSQGVHRGDRILLVLGNRAELWLAMLAAMKLGAVVIPATPLLAPADLRDRVGRAAVRHVVAESGLTPRFADAPGNYTRICVGEPVPGWLSFSDWQMWSGLFTPDRPTRADESLLLYFTSGTAAQPKLVEHTHASYPVGHLSTMYWIGLRPGDVHLNISSAGWAKHAWSCLFAPWAAGATVLIVNMARFSAPTLLDAIVGCEVTTFCAPPTVYRLLVQEDLTRWRPRLREMVGAGEPLNPEIIEQVGAAWGLTIRDGYGQTETTAQIGNPPGQPVKLGSMGRPLPGYVIGLLDPITGAPGQDGEICIDLSRRPVGLMAGYRDDPQRTAESMRGGWYHTGDVASRDAEGYLTYVGRSDDVFKASDYRISPFELESVLIEHRAVTEVAVVPSPDPIRLAVPKAYVVLAPGVPPSAQTALEIFRHARANLAPYQRVRRLEFTLRGDETGGVTRGSGEAQGVEMPKTISGKIRRVELRGREQQAHARPDTGTPVRGELEFWEEDFPELKS